MSIINSQPRIGAAGQSTGFKIERSLRFNSADSAYLSRTPSSAGNRKTWTWSGWVKRGQLGSTDRLFSAGSGTTYTEILTVNDTLKINANISAVDNGQISTVAVFRDPSAWYHVVVAVDVTAGTKAIIYVNGVSQTLTTTTALTNQNYEINNTVSHTLGNFAPTPASGEAWDGYITEVNFIDGQALTPSSFGETDTDTGVWKPKAYSGSYGTNGFYLKFADNSGTTSTTLGKDSSGNGNNWTPNNFSVTAGAGNDSLVDTPTPYGTDTGAGGEVRGNYCTLNPLSTTAGTYTQGNLRYVGAAAYRRSNATISLSTGKWYWEVTLGNAPFSPRGVGSQYNAFGFGLSTVFNSTTNPNAVTDAVVLADNAYYKNFSGSWTDSSISFSSGDVLSIAVDLDANSFTFYRNNSQVTTGTIGGTAGRELVPIIISYDGSYGVMDANFGQRPFAYTAPSGYKALCTQNLPTPTIGATATTRADDYFNTVLYTGTGSSQNITGVGFQPDFVWIKERAGAADHGLYDAVRGVQKQLESNTTTAETTETTGLTAFNSDGFTVGALAQLNTNTDTYVAWNWKANGAGSTNTDGTITSTVSANTDSGFSIVTFNSVASTNSTVGHGLGVAPSMIIVRYRGAISGWFVWHTALAGTQYLQLDTTGATATAATLWNSAIPTSTVFSMGTAWTTSTTSIAYCFAAVAGYSAFGSYTGNGSTDGPMVFTNHRPALVLVKRTDSTGNWTILDNKREGYNVDNDPLYPNLSDAEGTTDLVDIISNGFKVRSTDTSVNANGGTYIYMSIAENPFKYSLAR